MPKSEQRPNPTSEVEIRLVVVIVDVASAPVFSVVNEFGFSVLGAATESSVYFCSSSAERVAGIPSPNMDRVKLVESDFKRINIGVVPSNSFSVPDTEAAILLGVDVSLSIDAAAVVVVVVAETNLGINGGTSSVAVGRTTPAGAAAGSATAIALATTLLQSRI